MTVAPDQPPTVEGLCGEYLRVASWYTVGWCDRFPHLEAEFKSRAAFDLFTAARGYVAKGPETWERMTFRVWLKICVHRGCRKVIDQERNRHPVGFLPQDRSSLAGGEGAVDRAARPGDELADAEEIDALIGRVVELLEMVQIARPEEEVELLLRHLLDGEPISAIGDQAGCPHSTVHSKIAKALSWLRFAAGTEDKP